MSHYAEERHIQILGVGFRAYSVAVYRLLEEWLAGQVDTKPLKSLTSRCHISLQQTDDIIEEDVNVARSKLLTLGATVHFETTATHIQWIKRIYQFLTACGVKFQNPSKMDILIDCHDLSKYTPQEVLGYSIMFGQGNGIRKLVDPEESQEWENSLQSHLACNPHHPQYFKKNGEFYTDIVDQKNGKTYLEESIIDMLACRGERDLKNDEEFSLEKWMTIAPGFFGRYDVNDRCWVINKLSQWRDVVLKFYADECNDVVNQILLDDGVVRKIVSRNESDSGISTTD